MNKIMDPEWDDAALRAGHRQRLEDKFLDNKLSPAEVVELWLCDVIPRRDVRPLARRLMAKFGGVHQILAASFESLKQMPGVGAKTARRIKTVHALHLLDDQEQLTRQPIFHDITVLTNYCRNMLMGKEIEEFHVLYLDGDYKLLADVTHSVGTVDFAQVYPREIVQRALNLHARSIVLVHNHPTAGMPFSTPDIELTTSIRDILSPMGVELFDHYLVAGMTVYSARNLNFI
ncbi:hypothetical protein HDR63_01345 [bacterium]|nr:hypothetical protein [bacterium]